MPLKNREERNAYHREYYQKNKEKIRASKRDCWTKEQRKEYNDNYYKKNREKIIKYVKSSYRLKKMSEKRYKKDLALRKIIVTKEEIAIARKSAYMYAMKPPFYITTDEVFGDAYICLLMAISEYKKELYPNRNSFLSHTIGRRLIDVYRSEFGRSEDSHKRKFLTNMTSLNNTMESDGEEGGYIELLEAKNVSPETKMDAKFFREKVKTELGKIVFHRKVKGTSLYKMWYNYFVIGKTMDMIAEKNDMSEPRVSQLFTKHIKPCFEKLQIELREHYPEFVH